jgi:hypothetical protein
VDTKWWVHIVPVTGLIIKCPFQSRRVVSIEKKTHTHNNTSTSSQVVTKDVIGVRAWYVGDSSTYIFRFRSYLVTDIGRILDAKGGFVNFLEA